MAKRMPLEGPGSWRIGFSMAFAICLLSFCEPKSSQESPAIGESPLVQKTPPATTSPSSSWVGTYEGVLPCGHCEGIETCLTLGEGGTFELKTHYLGLNDAREEQFTGTISWGPTDSSQLLLLGLIGDMPGRYLLQENALLHLDAYGKKITGLQAERYLLKRIK
ncbi:MAG: copper resistance protein NlpE [Bacteroidetes bacterium]|nr:copper resistance protein NlpE [Bacteroidota bacterium]